MKRKMAAIMKLDNDDMSNESSNSFSSCASELQEDLNFRAQNLAYQKEIDDNERNYNEDVRNQEL